MVASFSTLPSSSSSVWTVNTAHLRMLFFRVSLDPPKPPVPPDPVPPEPPPRCCSDFPSSPSWYSLFVGSSISFPSSLRLIINYMQVFSMINLLDPCVAFVSSGDTSIAIVRPITAVCSLFPEAIRFSYGSYASFTSFFHVYMICRFSKVEMGKCSANSWSWNCDSRLFTIAFGLHKDTNCMLCLWLCFVCHCYSFMEIYVLSSSPVVGKSLFAGNESFFGVCGFAVASCLDMLSSKTLEVPLRDISVAYRSSTYTLVAEDIVAKTALSLNNALLLAWNEDSLVLQLFMDSQFSVKSFKSLEVTVELGRILLVLSFLHLRFIPLFFALFSSNAFVFAVLSVFSDVFYSCNGD